ncbi:MAG: 3-oxoacyl-ACP synthase, partial [Fuerstia sp.]|nr:3-oxoacyl-ACP synthase [Fuerstiella sp.]
ALLSHKPDDAIAEIGPTLVGTDGRGWQHLKIEGGGSRCPHGRRYMDMNGAEIFNFTLTSVTDAIGKLLANISMTWEQVDRFLLHQANGFILETLRKRMKLSPERCPIDLCDTGNTSSASLPLLLRRCLDRGDVASGHHCILAGYGVGYSWAITSIRILQDSWR